MYALEFYGAGKPCRLLLAKKHGPEAPWHTGVTQQTLVRIAHPTAIGVLRVGYLLLRRLAVGGRGHFLGPEPRGLGGRSGTGRASD